MKLSNLLNGYSNAIAQGLKGIDLVALQRYFEALITTSREGRSIFICGNGGSAANALHIANDLTLLSIRESGKSRNSSFKAIALPSNVSTLTCLANDFCYEDVFSQLLSVYSRPKDLLIVLSGSGNSPNILSALNTAQGLDLETASILGFDGGLALSRSSIPVHIPINDMQVVEDLQLIIMHLFARYVHSSYS